MAGGVSSSFVEELNDSVEKFSKCKSWALIPFSSPLVGAWEARSAENSSTSSVLLEFSRLGRWSWSVWVTCWKLYGVEIRCRRDESEALASFADSSSIDVSATLTVEVVAVNVAELALASFLIFLALLENMEPNIWTLSGLSDRDDGMLLAFDLADDLRDKLGPSVVPETESRERKEGVAEEKVFDLELFPNKELLFICSVYARIRSGEGGPSIAGSREAVDAASFFCFDLGVSFLGAFLAVLTE
jgi:hypothetical protein